MRIVERGGNGNRTNEGGAGGGQQLTMEPWDQNKW